MVTLQTSTCLLVNPWELPFRHEVKLQHGSKGDYLAVRFWDAYHISIRGESSSGYQLRVGGVANVTKRGVLGRLSRELMDGGSNSEAIFRAYRAWVEAGKPFEFTWND